jgi:hypothetical protein
LPRGSIVMPPRRAPGAPTAPTGLPVTPPLWPAALPPLPPAAPPVLPVSCGAQLGAIAPPPQHCGAAGRARNNPAIAQMTGTNTFFVIAVTILLATQPATRRGWREVRDSTT